MDELWNWDGERIKLLRIKIGCSVTAISKAMNIGSGTYITAESNRRTPSIILYLFSLIFSMLHLIIYLGK